MTAHHPDPGDPHPSDPDPSNPDPSNPDPGEPDPSEPGPTVLEVRPSHRAVLVIVMTVVGLALGLAAPYLLHWADGRDWLPFGAARRLLEQVADSTGSWVLILAGTVAGALVGLGITGDLTRVTITGAELIIVKGSSRQRFSRAQVSKALYDDKELVLRDDRDADLIRKQLDVPRDDVLAALRRHGWPVGQRRPDGHH